MKITNNTTTLSKLFEIEDGDIFLYEGQYFIAGSVDFVSHRRECYNLSIDMIRTFEINYTVYAWSGDDCELIIR